MEDTITTVLFDLNETIVHQLESQENLMLAAFTEVVSHAPGLSLNAFQEAWRREHSKRELEYRDGQRLLINGETTAARKKLIEPLHSESIANILVELDLVPSQSLIETVNSAFQRCWVSGLVMPQENRTVLEILKQEGFQLGIITNFQQPDLVPQILRQFRVFHLFDVVVISGTVGWRKPHPDIFLLALEQLGIAGTPKQAIYVGDCIEEDVVGAQITGMSPILIDPKAKYVDWMESVTRIESLVQILEVLNLPIAA